MKRSTIMEVITQIKDKFEISDEDAIIIKDVCEKVSNK